MSARRKKAAARALLVARDRAEIARFAREHLGALRTLFSLTYDAEELVRWRAIELLGPAAAAVGVPDPEPVRRFLRGLLWLMNDESGGLGWYAPEVLGEVLRAVPALVGEYAQLLPAFLDEEPFERGTHLALARLARLAPGVVAANADRLTRSLADPDPAVRAHALEALAAIDRVPAGRLGDLAADAAQFRRYDFDAGRLREDSVAAVARALR